MSTSRSIDVAGGVIMDSLVDGEAKAIHDKRFDDGARGVPTPEEVLDVGIQLGIIDGERIVSMIARARGMD